MEVFCIECNKSVGNTFPETWNGIGICKECYAQLTDREAQLAVARKALLDLAEGCSFPDTNVERAVRDRCRQTLALIKPTPTDLLLVKRENLQKMKKIVNDLIRLRNEVQGMEVAHYVIRSGGLLMDLYTILEDSK